MRICVRFSVRLCVWLSVTCCHLWLREYVANVVRENVSKFSLPLPVIHHIGMFDEWPLTQHPLVRVRVWVECGCGCGCG